jgi:hypothetical protein
MTLPNTLPGAFGSAGFATAPLNTTQMPMTPINPFGSMTPMQMPGSMMPGMTPMQMPGSMTPMQMPGNMTIPLTSNVNLSMPYNNMGMMGQGAGAGCPIGTQQLTSNYDSDMHTHLCDREPNTKIINGKLYERKVRLRCL